MTKRICVLGAGRWGQNHLRTLHGLSCLAGLVEVNEEVRTRAQTTYPGILSFDNLEDALAEDFDGFVVATPAETHRALAGRILEEGKPALVEKPLALTSKEARELRQLAEQNHTNLMVGHVLLFHPAIRKIKELVQSGKLGKLQHLYSNRLNLGTVRTEENILWSFAPHDISIFQHLIGDFPIEVTSRGGAFIQPHLHDSTITILTYRRNIIGHIFVSWLHPYKEHRLVLIGSKGMLSFDDSSDDKNLFFYEKGIDWIQGEPIKRDGPTEMIPYDRGMPLTEELRYFIQKIDGGSIEIADADGAVEVMEILELATESLLSQGSSSRGAQVERRYFVHPSSFVDDEVEIGDDTKIWHFCHIQSHARIGRGCSLGQNVNVAANVRIGNHVKIQNNVSIYEGVELEDYVFCGPSVVFTNVLDPRAKYPKKGREQYKRTTIKEGASLGANATIICGNTVGRHAFIGAGAVVTDTVPDYALMLGTPARRAAWVCECGETLPESTGRIRCTRCELTYRVREDRLVPDV